MSITHCVYVDVSRQSIEHRDFQIEESSEGWEWTHKNYSENGISGTSDTVFDAIEAVDDWYERERLNDGRNRYRRSNPRP